MKSVNYYEIDIYVRSCFKSDYKVIIIEKIIEF